MFTVVSLAFQFAIGLALAVFFHQHFRLSATLRALFLVPWLLPLIVSASTWAWMLNSDSGIVNAALGGVGIDPVNWLTSPDWSLVSVIIANIWIGIPFNLVVLYSGLQNIPAELYEAAALDGANGWQRFWRITFPLLRPVSAITLLLGLVYTLKVFDIIWIMTRGGPGDSSTTLRHLVLPARLRQPAARLRPRRRRRQPAHPHGARLRPASTSGSSARQASRMNRTDAADLVEDRASASCSPRSCCSRSTGWSTCRSPATRTCARTRRTCSRSTRTFDGYRAVLDQQLPYLGTSLLVGLGTVVLTVALAAPAGYALAKLRPRGGGALSFVLLVAQMIPGIIMAMGFYAIYLNLGMLNTVPGPDPRRLHASPCRSAC